MKVKNIEGKNGRAIPNQFIIKDDEGSEFFQSYNSVIVKKTLANGTYLDEYYWDYSTTTGKYRNQFLGENKAQTQKKIDSGEYKLVNLN